MGERIYRLDRGTDALTETELSDLVNAGLLHRLDDLWWPRDGIADEEIAAALRDLRTARGVELAAEDGTSVGLFADEFTARTSPAYAALRHPRLVQPTGSAPLA